MAIVCLVFCQNVTFASWTINRSKHKLRFTWLWFSTIASLEAVDIYTLAIAWLPCNRSVTHRRVHLGEFGCILISPVYDFIDAVFVEVVLWVAVEVISIVAKNFVHKTLGGW